MHLGAQIAVWRRGDLIADLAIGEAHPGVSNTTDRMLVWFSATKATVAVSIGLLWQQGRIDLDAPVATYVPEFGGGGKDRITIRHCLTHTGGFRHGDAVPADTSEADTWWDTFIAAVCALDLEPDWVPGRKAGYHAGGSMMILGECVRRIDGRRYERFVRDEVFEPLGMHDCWVGMPIETANAYVASGRVGTMYDTTDQRPRPLHLLDDAKALTFCSPAGTGRGPMNQLVRLYAMLVNGGALDGVRLLDRTTVEALTARHRTGMYDHSFGIPVDWTLGFVADGSSIGRHASPRGYGHGGAQSTLGFADPEFGIAAAIQFNGMPGSEVHARRMYHVASVLYEDLGLFWSDVGGRDKPIPAVDGMITA